MSDTRDGTSPSDQLRVRLREADGDELLELLRAHGEELDASAALQALANPFLERAGVEILAAQKRLLASYDVKRLLARHRATPTPLAMGLVPNLYWRDLAETSSDVRVAPQVRRAAERYLLERLPTLATGEKMSLARRASHAVLARLRHDPSPKVFRALLESPRLTEGVLVPLAANEQASPAILDMLARDRRWGVRYPVRHALTTNPATPVQTVLSLLPHLRKGDLAGVARRARLHPAVRRRARVLLGEAD